MFRLIELDEAMEALDAAIDYKNESIKSARDQLRQSQALSQVWIEYDKSVTIHP